MEEKQKIDLKARIEKKLKQVIDDIAAFEQLTKPISPDSAIGRLTRLEAMNSKSINEAALKKAKVTRANLERALDGIDDPDFGTCRQCEEPIPAARLLILPETSLCVKCAEALSE